MIKKKLFRFGSVFMCAALMACSLAACGTNTANINQNAVKEEQAASKASNDTISEAISNKFGNIFSTTSTLSDENSKDETVYVFTDALGKQDHVIVNENLKNVEKSSTISDYSTLNNIENLTGDETKTESGSKLTWSSQGNSITYQGTTSKEAPVTINVKYYLDGKAVTADELAGKSGEVTIRYEYTNNEKKTVNINGSSKTVYVPFTMVTGMMLPSDKFSNVKVTNGKVVEYDDGIIAMGVTMPGLKDSLKVQLGDEDLDINIPEYFEVKADVTDFELDQTMSIATSNLLDSVNVDNINLDGVKSDIDELSDGANQLVEGTQKLKDSTPELVEGTEQLAAGTNKLFSKMPELSEGILKLNQGAGALADSNEGLPFLAQSIKTYTDNVANAAAGSSQITDGLNTLAQNLKGDGTAQNPGMINGMAALEAGGQQLSDGLAKLSDAVEATKNEIKGNAATYNKNEDTLTTAQTLEGAAANINAALSALNNTDILIKPYTDLKDIDPTKMTEQQMSEKYQNLYKKYMDAYTFAKENSSNSTIQYLNMAIASNPGLQAVGITSLEDFYSSEMGLLVKTVSNKSISASLYSMYNQIDNTKDPETQLTLSGSINYMKNEVDTKLLPGMKQIKLGLGTMDQLTAATPVKQPITVCEALNKLALGSGELTMGLNQLTGYNTQLNEGANAAADGALLLSNGTNQLAESSEELIDGVEQLNTGADALNEGANELYEGIVTLNDGMIEFNDTGIKKLAELFGTDAQTALDTVKAVAQYGKDYQSFAGKADDMKGSVKFIYKTDGITK